MALSMSTIQRWFKHFESGNKSLEDQHRPGRPITETTVPDRTNFPKTGTEPKRDRKENNDETKTKTEM